MLREGFSQASLTLYHLTVDFIRLLGSFLQSTLPAQTAEPLPRAPGSTATGHRCNPADDGIGGKTV